MFLLKTRQIVGAYPTSCLTRWSSGMSEKSYEILKEHISKQSKIKSEKFKTFLPYIEEKIKSPPSYKLSASDTKLEKLPLSELTNILDSTPETEKTISSSNNENNLNEQSINSEGNISVEKATDGSSVVEKEELPPKSLPVLISSFDNKSSGIQWDLVSADPPISLHRDERNFLAVAVTNDLKHAYNKMLETTNNWRLQVQQQTDAIGSISLEKALVLVEKSSIWLCEQKKSSGFNYEESYAYKIRKSIEDLRSGLKKKMQEQKRAMEQKKAINQKNKPKTE